MTPADVAADVIGTVAEWLPGYTTPETGPQLRVDVPEVTEEPPSLLVTYAKHRYVDEGRRTFRVTLTVEEVKP